MRQAARLKYGRGALGVLAVAGFAFAASGCSNSSRFDMPAFGLTGSNATNADLTTTASVPVPSETVYSSSSDRYHYYGAKPQAPGVQVARNTLPPPASAPRVTPAAYTPAQATPPRPQTYGETKAPLPEPPVARAAMPQGAGFRVTVAQGDTLASLSQRYAVPIDAIISANDLPDARLNPGQQLFIPTSAKAAAQPATQAAKPQVITAVPGENTYKVETGDTLNSISAKLGVSPKAITDRNNIRPHQLQVGQVLVIPMAGSTAQAGDQPSVRSVKTTTIQAPGAASPATSEPSQLARVDQLPSPDPMSGNSFRWPVKGRVISPFGTRPDGSHNDGINVSVPQGTSVMAAENGVVAYSGSELKGYGNLVLVRHANNWVSAYAHNDTLLVKRGDKVRRGQVIAKAGATGSVSQPQVHFELRKGSRPVDPTKYMGEATASGD
ncbi:MAG: LysM peptidoglycan-binding domain-containing protein [Alphaproteobacteria bacterium]|nr:LysM peptidoglycan-binding domain-containing protein [Alphaproteobacteria bacterium]